MAYCGFQQVQAPFVGHILQVCTDRLTHPRCAQIFALVNPLFHGHKIDDAFQLVFCADGQSHGHSVCARAVFDHFHAVEKVSARFVHFVDEHNTRNFVAVGLTPYGFGLGFNASVAVQQNNSAVQNGQRTFNFDGKVNVSGGVDDVKAVTLVHGARGPCIDCVVPKRCGCSRGDRDATLLLLLHPVHCGRAIMHFADFVRLACVIQDAFCGGGLARIDMGNNPKVAVSV